MYVSILGRHSSETRLLATTLGFSVPTIFHWHPKNKQTLGQTNRDGYTTFTVNLNGFSICNCFPHFKVQGLAEPVRGGVELFKNLKNKKLGLKGERMEFSLE